MLQAASPEFDSQQCKIFLFSTAFQTDSGAHPASYPRSTGAFFPGVNQQGHEADHSALSSAEVKKGGAIPPLSHAS
jgi:hypothetical protein